MLAGSRADGAAGCSDRGPPGVNHFSPEGRCLDIVRPARTGPTECCCSQRRDHNDKGEIFISKVRRESADRPEVHARRNLIKTFGKRGAGR